MEWPNAAWLKWFEYRTELPRSLINPILFTQSNLNSRLRPSQDKIIWDFKERDSSYYELSRSLKSHIILS